jgi:hypothetical protein
MTRRTKWDLGQGKWVSLDITCNADGTTTITSDDVPALNLRYPDWGDHSAEIMDTVLNWVAGTPAAYERVMSRGPQDV